MPIVRSCGTGWIVAARHIGVVLPFRVSVGTVLLPRTKNVSPIATDAINGEHIYSDGHVSLCTLEFGDAVHFGVKL